MSENSDPVDILKQRFAKGEIDAESFEASMKVLGAHKQPAQSDDAPAPTDSAQSMSASSPDAQKNAFIDAMFVAGFMIDNAGKVSYRISAAGVFVPLIGGRVDRFDWPAAIGRSLVHGALVFLFCIVVISLAGALISALFSLDPQSWGRSGWIAGLIWVISLIAVGNKLYTAHKEYERFAETRDRIRQ
jgi:hypothetical protein